MLDFSYDFDKDVANFIRGTQSKNNPKPTKLQQSYIDKHGSSYEEETVRQFLTDYITETKFDSVEAARKIEEGWRPIEKVFIERAESMFGLVYPAEKIQVYISTNSRCTYRIEDGYFFVYANAKSPNMILMHELLHFYTWAAFHPELEAADVSQERYNDVKESLTDLLNVEFADLMEGAVDEGYPQHAEMRSVVRKTWLATKDMRRTILDALSSQE